MPEWMKKLFANQPVSPEKRILRPAVSAVASLFLPGSAQAVNGQTVKGMCVMLAWFVMCSLANGNGMISRIVVILQYIIRIAVSSDAYFIAARMKMGEEVHAWSILFLDMHTPTQSGSPAGRDAFRLRTLITDVTVIDGTGASAFRSDVLIEGNRISRIRPNIQRKEKEYTIVSGEGRILIPGFLNPCCCCERTLFADPESTEAVRRGMTTEILGQKGFSLAPVRDDESRGYRDFLSGVSGMECEGSTNENTGLYLMDLERKPTPAKLESLVGYGTLRIRVLGWEAKEPDEEGRKRLCSRVRSSLTSGAKGISLGMANPPCCFATEEELAAVFRTVAECDGLASVELPVGEGTLLASFERFAALAKETGVRLLLTNLHAVGTDRGLAETLCKRVSDLRAEGVEISLSLTGIPEYDVGLLTFTSCEMWVGTENHSFAEYANGPDREQYLAKTAQKISEQSGAGRISVAAVNGREPDRDACLTLEEIARREHCSAEEVVFRLLCENEGKVVAVCHTGDEDFMARLIRHPGVSLCTDRVRQTNAASGASYFLGKYVKKDGLLSMEEAVRRNTMELCAAFRLWDRGIIREGMAADLVLLRPELLPDSEKENGRSGISKVWVDGRLEYDTEPELRPNPAVRRKFMGLDLGR